MQAYETVTLKCTAKIFATDNAIIHGYVTYDAASGTSVPSVITLNDILIDLGDSIIPGHDVTDHELKNMWASFEWESKFPVQTSFG